MTLILSNEEIQRVLDMKTCLAVLEEAYRDLAEGTAITGLREDVAVPTGEPGGIYALKAYAAAFPRRQVGAVRINSDILSYTEFEGRRKRNKVPAATGGRWTGLILLFSGATGEPLAIFPDGVIQRARVGATSALAMRYMARPDAVELALIGTGWQAGSQVAAACAVHHFRRVRVFSRTAEHREAFRAEWEEAVGVPIESKASVEEAVRGADVVLCATNSLAPVMSADRLEPGMHVGIVRMAEIGDDVIRRADVVVRHLASELAAYQVAPGADTLDLQKDRGWGARGPDRVAGFPELTDLIAGRVQGRAGPEQITLFLNNGGIGLQFAAVGHAVWERARELGIGHDLPTDWFTENVHP
jgi:ornithine cyclodeaminase/alanine dehydrogenase-like protein (mu-crystallin family)